MGTRRTAATTSGARFYTRNFTGVDIRCASSLFERYAKSGDNPKLKDWAGKTLPTLQHHLQMAENLKKRD